MGQLHHDLLDEKVTEGDADQADPAIVRWRRRLRGVGPYRIQCVLRARNQRLPRRSLCRAQAPLHERSAARRGAQGGRRRNTAGPRRGDVSDPPPRHGMHGLVGHDLLQERRRALQSIRSRCRKPRLNQDVNRCTRSTSTALSEGSSGSSVSRSSRIATMVAVPFGAMLMRRKKLLPGRLDRSRERHERVGARRRLVAIARRMDRRWVRSVIGRESREEGVLFRPAHGAVGICHVARERRARCLASRGEQRVAKRPRRPLAQPAAGEPRRSSSRPASATELSTWFRRDRLMRLRSPY